MRMPVAKFEIVPGPRTVACPTPWKLSPEPVREPRILWPFRLRVTSLPWRSSPSPEHGPILTVSVVSTEMVSPHWVAFANCGVTNARTAMHEKMKRELHIKHLVFFEGRSGLLNEMEFATP